MILSEIDAALIDEARKLASAPRDTSILIVLSTEARNEFMQRFTQGERSAAAIQHGIMGCKYRGAIMACTLDPDMPRVSVFTKVKT